MSEAEPVVWTTERYFPDCAFAGIGDPAMIGDERWLSGGLPCLVRQRNGSGMVYGQAECDGPPIEFGRLDDRIAGVRLEFTTDVADVEGASEGAWTDMGRIRIGGDGAIVIDAKRPNNPDWECRVPLTPGWYRGEAFALIDGDHLGIRIMEIGIHSS